VIPAALEWAAGINFLVQHSPLLAPLNNALTPFYATRIIQMDKSMGEGMAWTVG
jgi:hypothetical protein